MTAVILAFLGTGLGKIVVGILGAFLAAGLAYLRGRSTGKLAERNRQRAKEADAYEKSLQELAEASAAANRVQPSDSLSDDPNNRDRQG